MLHIWNKHILLLFFGILFFGACKKEETSDNKGFAYKEWRWTKDNISVCWVPEATTANEAQKKRAQNLVVNTWGKHIDIRFTGWNDCTAAGAIFFSECIET